MPTYKYLVVSTKELLRYRNGNLFTDFGESPEMIQWLNSMGYRIDLPDHTKATFPLSDNDLIAIPLGVEVI